MSEIKDVLIELEDYMIYSKYLLEEKGVEMSPTECYKMVQWFKDSSNDSGTNPTQSTIFKYGHKIAMYMVFCTEQMYDLYEIYYALTHGMNAIPANKQPLQN